MPLADGRAARRGGRPAATRDAGAQLEGAAALPGRGKPDRPAGEFRPGSSRGGHSTLGRPELRRKTGAEPLSTIEIGKTVKRLRYLRTGEGGTIEVADAKLLNAVDEPVALWRERALVPLGTFQIDAVSIKCGGKTIRVARSPNGRFRLLEPNVAPAEGPKVESLMAAIVSLRVADAEKGFVADNARDLGPYGLSPPSAVVELTTTLDKDKPLVLEIGKRVPDQPDRVYVRQGDQNDVVMVSTKPVEELPQTAVSLRSQKVCDFEPIAVSELRIKSPGLNFLLKKEANGWVQKEPTEEKADAYAVMSLLKQLDALQTSEFLEPERSARPEARSSASDHPDQGNASGTKRGGIRRQRACCGPASRQARCSAEDPVRPARSRRGHFDGTGHPASGDAQECDGVPGPISWVSGRGGGSETDSDPRWSGRRART